MKWQAQPVLSVGGQRTLDQYTSALRQEDLMAKTIHNYLSDLRQFIARCESSRKSSRLVCWAEVRKEDVEVWGKEI